MNGEVGYRPDIDGLRAIAVLSVIFFHTGLDFVPGGYLGVDIFFVISGYLITSIITADLARQRFSYRDFYERRARRILPALAFVTAFTLLFGYLWLLPHEMQDLSRSVISVCVFASNLFFERKDGYFAPDSSILPMLHTWSLAIEEQFYLIFPLLIVTAISKSSRRLAIIFIALVCIVSFSIYIYSLRYDPIFAFYSLPARAWELMVGSLCSFAIFKPNTVRDEVLSAIAIAVVLASVVYIRADGAFLTAPSAVPVVAATAILLLSGQRTMVGKLLSARLPVSLGLSSYGAYLWHQPLFAFAQQRTEAPSTAMLIAIGLASVALGFASRKFVETPFRIGRKATQVDTRTFCIVIIGAFCALAAVAGLGERAGFPGRFDRGQLAIAAYERYDFPSKVRGGDCFVTGAEGPPTLGQDCVDRDYPVALWGDSHAAALYPGFAAVLGGRFDQLTLGRCPPIVGFDPPDSPNCRMFNDSAMASLRSARPQTIFLHADWSRYRSVALAPALAASIRRLLAEDPNARIIVIGGVPQWRRGLPKAAIEASLRLDREASLPNSGLDQVIALDQELAAATLSAGGEFLSATDAMCRDGLCKAVIESDGGFALTTWDYGHLTSSGSEFLAAKLFHEKSNIQ